VAKNEIYSKYNDFKGIHEKDIHVTLEKDLQQAVYDRAKEEK
jgi:hypothetical protein